MEDQMKVRQLFTAGAMLAGVTFQTVAADWYVSFSTGKNKNAGTQEAPLKNIWKALESAAPGDTIHIAEGNYSGKMSCGWINMDKPVNLIGGYSPDFSTRNPLVHHTMLRPKNEQNATRPTFGTLTIKTRKAGANASVLIDGFIFDHTAANSYHPVEGKPEGFSDGMLTIPPAKGKTRYPSIDKALLNAETDGSLTIQNCLFLNGSNYAILVAHFSGTVKILNNVFIGNRMMGADVRSTNGKPGMVEFEFSNNTLLFTWTRTKAFEDMGFGVRANANMSTNIHHNIIGLNTMSGFDNTKGNDKTKAVTLEDNIFFLNKTADVTVTISPSIKFMKVEDEGFDDLADVDGMKSVKDNLGLKDPALFKGIIDENYLNAFLAATYSEKVEYDENSPINQFRAALGLNKQGKITSKVSMFANPYPFDSAIKFFGAVQGTGAQIPAQQ
ncbi:MAG TPA: hypothetical protein DD673_03055 [Lentisphaeria bacterium]|nr:hypothetical protein [Lentisphaeria bacterium]